MRIHPISYYLGDTVSTILGDTFYTILGDTSRRIPPAKGNIIIIIIVSNSSHSTYWESARIPSKCLGIPFKRGGGGRRRDWQVFFKGFLRAAFLPGSSMCEKLSSSSHLERKKERDGMFFLVKGSARRGGATVVRIEV